MIHLLKHTKFGYMQFTFISHAIASTEAQQEGEGGIK